MFFEYIHNILIYCKPIIKSRVALRVCKECKQLFSIQKACVEFSQSPPNTGFYACIVYVYIQIWCTVLLPKTLIHTQAWRFSRICKEKFALPLSKKSCIFLIHTTKYYKLFNLNANYKGFYKFSIKKFTSNFFSRELSLSDISKLIAVWIATIPTVERTCALKIANW